MRARSLTATATAWTLVMCDIDSLMAEVRHYLERRLQQVLASAASVDKPPAQA